MERWADCSRAGCCWLWTDVETWTRSPWPWTPRSFKQRCAVLCRSDTQWSPPTGFTKQQQVTRSTRAWWDWKIRGSRSPGGGYNSITRQAGRQAGSSGGFQMCMCVCVSLHHIMSAMSLTLPTLPVHLELSLTSALWLMSTCAQVVSYEMGRWMEGSHAVVFLPSSWHDFEVFCELNTQILCDMSLVVHWNSINFGCSGWLD